MQWKDPSTVHKRFTFRPASVIAASCDVGGQVIIDERVAVAVDGTERLLLSHNVDLGVATHEPHNDRAVLHPTRFLHAT